MSGRLCVSVSHGSIREVVELKADGLTIGREASDFIIDDPRVSRLHLRLELDGETVSARDTSTNGTKLNGKRMVRGEAVALKEGDELRIVLKEDLMPTPPHAICPEKLKVVFVFHLDVDEARRRVAQATAHRQPLLPLPPPQPPALRRSAPHHRLGVLLSRRSHRSRPGHRPRRRRRHLG